MLLPRFLSTLFKTMQHNLVPFYNFHIPELQREVHLAPHWDGSKAFPQDVWSFSLWTMVAILVDTL
jgi:hypothetical protein